MKTLSVCELALQTSWYVFQPKLLGGGRDVGAEGSGPTAPCDRWLNSPKRVRLLPQVTKQVGGPGHESRPPCSGIVNPAWLTGEAVEVTAKWGELNRRTGVGTEGQF